jgi:hypothetical protein
MPERFSRSLGRPLREQTLPWDTSSIVSARLFRPAAAVLACGSACAAGVTASTGPGGGISGTARTRSAGNSCAAGRPPSGSNSGVSSRKFVRRMRRRSESGEPGGVPQACVRPYPWARRERFRRKSRTKAGRRGHAAKALRLFFVTGLAVTTRCASPAAARRATAATVVAKPSVVCAIANVSG